MRRCPGFQLLTENYDYHCRKGVPYHVTITMKAGHLAYAVDGRTYLEAYDRNRWVEGLIRLRTFRTDLWWDNIRVVRV